MWVAKMRIRNAIANKTTLLRCFLYLATAACFLSCPRLIADIDLAQQNKDIQGGVALGLFASEPNYNYQSLLEEIRLHHGQRLLVVIPFYLDTVFDHEMRLEPGLSPSVHNVERTLGQAKRFGFEITVMPIVRIKQRDKGDWRGRIAPRLGHQAFFEKYEAAILPIVRLSQQFGVTRFVVGSELVSLEHERALWAELIKSVRVIFKGRLSYAANWDHFRGPDFWDLVDEIGVSSYFELKLDESEGQRIQQATKQWRLFLTELDAFAKVFEKPLFLMEVGYPAQITAARWPWDDTRHDKIDLDLQADLYRAFCNALHTNSENIRGFFFWNWFGFGGPTDDSYTPRGKPAALVMKQCLLQF